jgi:hypothetical protein
MMRENGYGRGVGYLTLVVLLMTGALAYAEKMIGLPATVDMIDLQTKSMKVTYRDPGTNATKQQEVYWDSSTEFIREGTPPDFKEGPAKAADIRKGSQLYIRITNSGARGEALRLDAVRIKP